MNDVIIEYQKWKLQGEDLRTKAKLAMETRFRDLLLEAVKVAEEYHADFGGVLKAPPAITTFRYKAGKIKKQRPGAAKPGATKPGTGEPKKAAAPAVPDKKMAVPVKPDRKIVGLQKRLQTARRKLDAAKSAGAPTRDLDDKVYELEDALKVALSGD
jgi:hypothetical protein